jgi:hypothetical protein
VLLTGGVAATPLLSLPELALLPAPPPLFCALVLLAPSPVTPLTVPLLSPPPPPPPPPPLQAESITIKTDFPVIEKVRLPKDFFEGITTPGRFNAFIKKFSLNSAN